MEALTKLFFKLIRPLFLNPLFLFLFRLYFNGVDKKNILPPINYSFLLLPAVKLAKKIRNKELTSTQVVQAYIERIEQIQPILNCVVANRFKQALEEAKQVDQILQSDTIPEQYNEDNSPLLGVPFSCKECFWVKDMPCATGLVDRKEFRAPDDADIVKNMRKAGAILLCVTNTSELCIWLESRNELYGVTKNPYNLSRIVGGSSGGEGCLLSSAGSVIGIGSDIGGSIRMPGFFNGIYGHKSSYGLIPNNVQFPPVEGEHKKKMLTSGPMCRYASDLRHMFKIQAGDLYSQMADKFQQNIELKNLNYFYIESFDECTHASKVSEECRDAMKRAVDFIEKSFNKKVVKIDSAKFKDAYMIWVANMRNGNNLSLDINKAIMCDRQGTFNPYLELMKLMFGCSRHTLHSVIYCIVEKKPLDEAEKYIKMGDDLRKYFNDLLGENSIILSPGFPTVAPYHNQPAITNTYDFIYFGLYNFLRLPSTQCPMGLSPTSGLPTGIQIVSNDKCDHLTIRLAEYFEENLVGWTPSF